MTCKNCIHYDVCSFWANHDNPIEKLCDCCEFEMNENKVIELPCKVGDKVYSFCEAFGSVLTYKIECVHFWSNSVIEFEAFSSGNDELLDTIDFELDDIGKTVFLIKE